MYNGYHFMGMHLLWWFFWILFVGGVFGLYQPVRRNRAEKSVAPTRNLP